MTRWAPGITFAAISRDGGASATHGALSFEVEVHRAGQADRAQHVRQHVSRHAGASRGGRAGIRSGRPGKVAATAGRAARQIGRWLMALTPDLAVRWRHAGQ